MNLMSLFSISISGHRTLTYAAYRLPSLSAFSRRRPSQNNPCYPRASILTSRAFFSSSTATMAPNPTALDFVDFVNASPTRVCPIPIPFPSSLAPRHHCLLTPRPSLPCRPIRLREIRKGGLRAHQGARLLGLDRPPRRQVLPYPQRLLHRRLRRRPQVAPGQRHRRCRRPYRLPLPPRQARL